MSIRGFRAGRVLGIELYVDYSWLIILALVIWVFSAVYFPTEYKGLGNIHYLILGFVSAILFFLSALLHEFAHSLVAIRNRIKIKKITLFLFGGISELFEEPNNPSSEFKIAIAGPATSIVLSIIFAVLWNISENFNLSVSFIAIFKVLFQVNAILAVFNLLPGFPLDGGRILRSFLWYTTKNLTYATRIATYSGQLVSVLIIIFGILQILITGFWGGVWLILIGLFLYQAASQSYLEIRIKNILKKKKVVDLVNKHILSINPSLTIDDALSEYFLNYADQSFPVVENDEVIGLISLEEVRKNNFWTNPDTRVYEVMKPYPKKLCISSTNNAKEALKKMIENEVSFIPIKDNDKIIGMLTLDSIADYLHEKNVI